MGDMRILEMELSMRFTAIETFHSTETGSDYIAGLSYTARDKKLRKLAAQWIKQGKVREGGAGALMQGAGDVVPVDDPKYQHFFNAPSDQKGD